MQSVLNKRILRDFKQNKFRYIALLLLISLSMYIVLSVVGAADTIISGTERLSKENNVEDGQFSTFLPLTDTQINKISDKGVDVQQMFSLDMESENGDIIRVMKNRDDIDLVQVDDGRLAQTSDEVALEKRYCEENNIKIGDTVKISDCEFKVVGIGSSPDYDLPKRNYTDISVESSSFGIAFVTSEQYDVLRKNNEQIVEDYCYAYRLNGKMTDDELKEMIKGFDFDYNEVSDKFFKDEIENALEQKNDLQDGITELYDGSQSLSDGLNEIDSNSKTLVSSSNQIFKTFLLNVESSLLENYKIDVRLTRDNYKEILTLYVSQHSEIQTAIDTLNAVNEYCTGVEKYTDGVNSANNGAEELNKAISELKLQTDRFIDDLVDIDVNNLTSFVKASDNPKILAAADDLIINKEVGIAAGVIIIVLFAYVISVFVVHQIQQESSVIGTLYAMGVKKRSLVTHYVILPTIICLLGGLIGLALSYTDLGIKEQMADTYAYFSVPELSPSMPLYLLIYGVIMPPLISVLVNYIVINRKLSKTALSLIRNEQKTVKASNISLKNSGFVRSFQIRQMLRESRIGITVVLAMILSMLILMLALDCAALCIHIQEQNKTDTRYEYMYSLKYMPKKIPEGGEAVYSEALSKTQFGNTLNISVMGLPENDKYFNCSTVKGQSNVIISSSMAQKYGYKTGDKIILSDEAEGKDYAFTVQGVADYSVGLSVFMDIDSMRELFGRDDDYYNVLFSDDSLDIEEGRLYSTTTKVDVERSADIFITLMTPMVIMLSAVAAIIFCIVLYLMMKVMVDRSSQGIALVKIFGYKNSEIRKLYLNGNLLTVIVGAIISIPLSKYVMDAMFPMMIANVACGMDLSLGWLSYIGIFAAVIILYFVINAFLMHRIRKISPSEALKNRE